jgi:hypothetical protein
LEEDLERLEPELGHPGRLALHFGDLANDLFVDPLAALEDVLIGRIVKPVLIVANSDAGFQIGCHNSSPRTKVALFLFSIS